MQTIQKAWFKEQQLQTYTSTMPHMQLVTMLMQCLQGQHAMSRRAVQQVLQHLHTCTFLTAPIHVNSSHDQMDPISTTAANYLAYFMLAAGCKGLTCASQRPAAAVVVGL